METNIIKYEKINPIFTDTHFSKFAKSIIKTNIIMKATELRIGNYIEKSLKSGQGRSVIDKVTFTNLQRIFEESGSMNFNPIQLTEELLIKCGWGKGEYDSEYTDNVSLKQEVLSYNVNSQMFCIETNCDVIEIKHIQYLHQLQNLYFALTGQELEINL